LNFSNINLLQSLTEILISLLKRLKSNSFKDRKMLFFQKNKTNSIFQKKRCKKDWKKDWETHLILSKD